MSADEVKDIVREDPLQAMMIEFHGQRTLDQWLEATERLAEPALVREKFASVTPELVAEVRNAGGIRW